MNTHFIILLALTGVFFASKADAQHSSSSLRSVSNTKVVPPSENEVRAQNVFVEIGGQGLLFTANYDTRFANRRDGLGGRVGIGYIGGGGESATTIPLSLNYLLGNGGKHFFEIGLGATVIASKIEGSFFFPDGDEGNINKNSNLIGTMSFSYRLQPINNGFSLRAGLTPIFDKEFFIPYFGGLSLGYTF